MPRFALIYRGGKPPQTPEEGKAHMTRWHAWRDGLGTAFVVPGMPLAQAVTVSATGVSEGSGDVPLSGVSFVEAADLEAATRMAESCPHLDLGGDIVVAQGLDMEM